MRYILNADDFGGNERINAAVVEGFRQRCLSRTSIMVNRPGFEDAVRLAHEHGFTNRVGLHVNLSTGIPLTNEIRTIESFCDCDGKFNSKIFHCQRMKWYLTKREKTAVKKEIAAQIKRYRSAGFALNHADSHGHIHTFPSMISLFICAMNEGGINDIRISMNLTKNRWYKLKKIIPNIMLCRFNHEKAPCYFGSLKQVIHFEDRLAAIDGKCEIMLHPNIWDGKVKIGECLSYVDIPVRIKERMI